MANIASNQCFYSLTLEPSQAINAACIANLIPNTSSSNEQLVEAKGSRLIVSLLERYGPDNDQIKVTPVVEHDCFGIIRGVESVRIPGTTRGMPNTPRSAHERRDSDVLPYSTAAADLASMRRRPMRARVVPF